MAGLSAALYYYTVFADFKRVLMKEQSTLNFNNWRKPTRDSDETMEAPDEDPCVFPLTAVLGLDPEPPSKQLNVKAFIQGPLAELMREVVGMLGKTEDESLKAAFNKLLKLRLWHLSGEILAQEGSKP